MQQVDGGIILFDTIYIGDGAIPSGVVLTLRKSQWKSVLYAKNDEKIIEYPGEYELSGYKVTALVFSKTNELNYVIRFSNKKIAFIQNKNILEEDDVSDMDTWYVVEKDMQELIERRDLWGVVQLVE